MTSSSPPLLVESKHGLPSHSSSALLSPPPPRPQSRPSRRCRPGDEWKRGPTFLLPLTDRQDAIVGNQRAYLSVYSTIGEGTYLLRIDRASSLQSIVAPPTASDVELDSARRSQPPLSAHYEHETQWFGGNGRGRERGPPPPPPRRRRPRSNFQTKSG